MNHMIHNLTPTPETVYITYELDFIPDGAPAAQGIQTIETAWLDTVGGGYPVFDAKRGSGGRDRRLTYPDEAAGARRPSWTVPEDGAVVGTGGHLHPGGLWTDLTLTRNGSGLSDPRELLSRPVPRGGAVAIRGFVYGQGDLSATGRRGRPARVREGRSLTFVNRDPAREIFHTVTACRAPCNRTTGIAYPLADGKVDFDSGELGVGPQGFTPAANRITWKTPKSLDPGKYTYFCRVHPFMRGAFEVKPRS